MNKRKIISILALAMTLGFGVYYYTQHREDFRLITAVSVDAIVILALLKLMIIFCYGLQVKVLTDHYNLNLDFTSWFGLSRLTSFTNMLLPLSGGASLKAVYLKKVHGLNYGSFIVLSTIAHIIKLVVTAAFASVLILMIVGRAGYVLLALSGAIFIGAMGFFLIADSIGERYCSSGGYIKNLIGEWLTAKADRIMVKRLVLLNCFIFIISTLEVYFSFRAFNIDASIVSSGIISSFSTFTGALRLTPANLGLMELVYMSLSDILGTGANSGLHAVALQRLIGTVLTLVLAPGFAWRLSKKAQ